MLDTVAMQEQLSQEEVANRLRAIREYMRMDRTPFAAWLGVPRTRYANWESTKGGNYPSRVAMDNLCRLLPGLTLDYIYRGTFANVPSGLAVQLAAWEQNVDPDTVGFNAEKFAAIVARRMR